MNLVEAQIKQEEEDRKHEEEYAKMEIVLQNNLMRTKVCKTTGTTRDYQECWTVRSNISKPLSDIGFLPDSRLRKTPTQNLKILRKKSSFSG